MTSVTARPLLLLLLGACVEPFNPSAGWNQFEPPGQYRVWHAEVQTCTFAWRSFDNIVWRKVHAYVFHCGDRDDAIGCLDLPDTIYLAKLTLNSSIVVKSELIHYVRQNGLHDALFTRCGG
jgi:hypothetical protein